MDNKETGHNESIESIEEKGSIYENPEKSNLDESPVPALGDDISGMPEYGEYAEAGYGAPGEPEKKKKNSQKGCLFGMGCLGCGLLGCLGMFVLLIVCSFIAFSWFANNIMSSEPLDIKPVYLNGEEEKDLKKRVEDFKKEVEARTGKPVELTLTAREINFLFQATHNKKNNYQFNVEPGPDGKIRFKFTTRIDNREPDKYYINLKGSGKFEIKDGKLETELDSLTIGSFTFSTKRMLKVISGQISRELSEFPAYEKLPYKIQSFIYENEQYHIAVIAREGRSLPDIDFDKAPSEEGAEPQNQENVTEGETSPE